MSRWNQQEPGDIMLTFESRFDKIVSNIAVLYSNVTFSSVCSIQFFVKLKSKLRI